MSRNSTFARSRGCPNCGGDCRPTAPLVPAVEAYQCDACGHRFQEGGV